MEVRKSRTAEVLHRPIQSKAVRYGLVGVVLAALTLTGRAIYVHESSGADLPVYESFPSSVYCFSANRCLVSGSDVNADVILTDDGGKSWSNIASLPTIQDITDIACSSGHTCVAVGKDPGVKAADAPAALFSSDAGVDWQTAKVPQTSGAFNGVSCFSASRCVAVGFGFGGTFIDTTTDGGAAWTASPVPDDYGIGSIKDGLFLQGVSCVSVQYCVSVGEGTFVGGKEDGMALSSDNGGLKWSLLDLPSTFAIKNVAWGVDCLSATKCFVVGENGNYSEGGAFSEDGQSLKSEDVKENLGPLTDVSCASSSDCVAVGTYAQSENKKSHIVFTDDGGVSWLDSSAPTLFDLDSVSCAIPTFCVAVGSQSEGQGVALYSTDDGRTWSTGL